MNWMKYYRLAPGSLLNDKHTLYYHTITICHIHPHKVIYGKSVKDFYVSHNSTITDSPCIFQTAATFGGL